MKKKLGGINKSWLEILITKDNSSCRMYMPRAYYSHGSAETGLL